MGRAFVYVIVGGGVAAGYAALEFTRKGVSDGELCIISDEPVAPYERPALSKGFLLPEDPSRPPSFNTCVGANDEILTAKWYNEHGIELLLGTRVKSVDVRRQTLVSSTGESITYNFLIIATGASALKLEEFGVEVSDAENVCYLRDLNDAERLATMIQSSPNGNAVVIGGGYIGMECAASLVINKINVTMALAGAHCMARLFTPKIASFYEDYYRAKGVKFIKGTVVTSFEFDSNQKVTAVNLKDGNHLPADLVVVGIGIRPNISLFEGQLTIEKEGIKVNSKFQSSDSTVYAIGDVATLPVKLYGETRRLEHVDSARKSARHAVSAIMEPEKTGEFDYLPCFYSRVFAFSWQFYGDSVGEVVHFGEYEEGKVFGAYWVKEGFLVGTFLEGGSKEEYETISKATERKPAVTDMEELGREGLGFAQRVASQPVVVPEVKDVVQSSEMVSEMVRQSSRVVSLVTKEKPLHVWHAVSGVVVAASVTAFAFWYGRRRRGW